MTSGFTVTSWTLHDLDLYPLIKTPIITYHPLGLIQSLLLQRITTMCCRYDFSFAESDEKVVKWTHKFCNGLTVYVKKFEKLQRT